MIHPLEHVEGLRHYIVCPECGGLCFEHDSRSSPPEYADEVICQDCGWRWEPDNEDTLTDPI